VRWEALPELKRAELIEGVVYVASPISIDHSDFDMRLALWLGYYASAAPGCDAGHNATWRMLESAPQPDLHLRLRPESGGQCSVSLDGRYFAGVPELAVEICLTSTEVDFGPKLRLYQRAGVREYITVELFLKPRITWRVLRDNKYYARIRIRTASCARPCFQVCGWTWTHLSATTERAFGDAPGRTGHSGASGVRGPAAAIARSFRPISIQCLVSALILRHPSRPLSAPPRGRR
jgi:hypothetical protein